MIKKLSLRELNLAYKCADEESQMKDVFFEESYSRVKSFMKSRQPSILGGSLNLISDLMKAKSISNINIESEEMNKGRKLPIGTIRKRGDAYFQKTADGWKYKSKSSGKKKASDKKKVSEMSKEKQKIEEIVTNALPEYLLNKFEFKYDNTKNTPSLFFTKKGSKPLIPEEEEDIVSALNLKGIDGDTQLVGFQTFVLYLDTTPTKTEISSQEKKKESSFESKEDSPIKLSKSDAYMVSGLKPGTVDEFEDDDFRKQLSWQDFTEIVKAERKQLNKK